MAWTLTQEPGELLAAAGPFLRARTANSTVLLSECERLVAGGRPHSEESPLFGWWRDGEAVTGAFIHTPPFPLHFSAVPEHALAALAGALGPRELVGVSAGAGQVEAFAAAWCDRRGATARTALRMTLYRLAALRPPEPPPRGRAVVAGPEHHDLLVAWLGSFHADIGGSHANPADLVADRIAQRAYTMWHDDAGTPVALAGASRPVEGSRRIGPVHTFKPHRGRGYGAAVTAAACRRALDEGASELVLFADAANPGSNRLYRRLGFEALEERVELRFTASAR